MNGNCIVRIPCDPSVIRIIERGPPGPPGANGDGAIVAYNINNASSYTANHTFEFPPNALLIDSSGIMVDTDITYINSQVILSFPQPFTGTLFLG